MVSNLRKYLALAAAVTLTAALGTGCSGQKANDAGPANVKVAVSTQALQSDIGSIQLTIDGQPDSPGAPGFPIVTLLSKDPGAGNVWTGNVTGIPANAAGLKRTFTAIAYQGPNATGAQLYQGSTVATVVAAQTAQVTIMLQELNATPGPQNYAPVIAAVNATNSYVLPGTAGSFSVTAYDPDDAAHFNRPQFAGTLAYQWSATCDNGTLSLATPNAATTAFVAPSVTNALCTVNIKVSETGLANNSSVTTY